ncbi:MAG: hypothetical protein LLG04_10550 [Parachlamydia sp.]|nr:hypothetical protein [Parachlamydia sp.]
MKVKVDRLTVDQAIDYANREAKLNGFDRNSEAWQRAYQRSLRESVGTMTIGRNPFERNPRDENTWPEVFGENGFAGKVAYNYKGRTKSGTRYKKQEISERIKGAVSTLVYLYMNGIMQIKTSADTSASGKINATEMSDLQWRGSSENMSRSEADEENKKVIMNQIVMTVVETAVYEFLLPFFTMPESEIRKITDKIEISGKPSVKSLAEQRTALEKKLRQRIGDKLKKISFSKLVLED